MDDVKKTWCAPAWLLDPERLERQLDRLSAEGWQLEGAGWFSLRYRRGKPNEYRYRVQYLYESRDGQRDDYVRGLAELGVEPVLDIGSFLILRRRNDGTPFELFSDLDSQITSEKRYLRTRGSRELRFFMRFLQDKHERMSGRERQKQVAFSGEKTIINYQCATSVVHSA